MIRALFSAASGMNAQQMNVDNIANNLANANTAGFKARRAQFQDLLYQNMVQPGASASQQSVVPTRAAIGIGNPRGLQRNYLHARRFFADHQSSGRGHSRKRFLPGPNAIGHFGVYPRWPISTECRGQRGGRQRQPAATAHHSAAERTDGYRSPRMAQSAITCRTRPRHKAPARFNWQRLSIPPD